MSNQIDENGYLYISSMVAIPHTYGTLQVKEYYSGFPYASCLVLIKM